MKPGDRVRIYPHGSPEKSAEAVVILYGEKEPPKASLAVAFGETFPPFATAGQGAAITPEHGIVMLLYNLGIGPWIEMFGQGHYEIELVASSAARHQCDWCGEPLLPSEIIDPAAPKFMHHECVLRAVIGSVAHIEGRCSCYTTGSEEGDPPGMSKRDAARAAVLAYNAASKLSYKEPCQ